MYPQRLNETWHFILLVISFIICKAASENTTFTFPDDFLLGTSTSAYQIEGAWNLDGKSENIWDHFVHSRPERVEDRSNGDVTCDFYHKYKSDIAIVKSFGFNHFRFSISWARIFPNGFATEPNIEGVLFYHKILDELEKYRIIPVVTIYHWDHPQVLEKYVSWTDSYMAYLFADYAKFIFQEYGSRVKIFVSINEPQVLCTSGYGGEIYAPGRNLSNSGMYLCLQNILKANALAYHIYDREFREEQGGKIGIVIPCFYFYAKNSSDLETVDTAYNFDCGWAAHPIFSKKGDYPDVMKKLIGERSKLRGLCQSELPTLSKKWIKLIRGSADFFGLNHYTSKVVEPLPVSQRRDWPNSEGITYSKDPSWQTASLSWLHVVPQGFGDLLRKIKEEYGNPEVFITECGVPDAGGINDDLRLKYLYSYMREMLIAVNRDKCNVKAFTIWSFLDSFEWDSGFNPKFGLVHVDFNDENLTRTLKKSAPWLKQVIKSKSLQSPLNC